MKDEFYNNPEKLMPIDGVGDLYVQWFYDRYAALRLLKNIPIFEQAYQLLTERKNFSKQTAFGEMHCDRYLWIEKSPNAKVLVLETQSQKFMYISSDGKFHIRQLFSECDEPYMCYKLKGVTVKAYKEAGFLYNTKNPKVFRYGDGRDIGYIASLDVFASTYFPVKMDFADGHTLWGINQMEYWKPYLDDPEELE